MKKLQTITPAVENLITEALAIEEEAAKEAGAIGFMARALVQATLPHRKVEGSEFVRTNGHFSLSIMAPSRIGLPYGTVPRLLLAWLTTEAVRTKSRELELGDTLAEFMRELGMGAATGGSTGTITRLKDQMTRLFSSSITGIYEGKDATAILNRTVADKAVLWWHPKAPEQAGLWRSTVTLSQPFFEEITDKPVPVDLRAIQALKRSPLALDIYTWLAYRAAYVKKPTVIPWEGLAMQFGSDYKLLRQFKAAFLDELRKVVTVYGGAQVEPTEGGLLVKPSLPHIARKVAA